MINSRIGHLAGNTEVFIRRHRAGFADGDTLHILICGRPVANEQLLKMYKRNFPIIDNGFLDRVMSSKIFCGSGFYGDYASMSNNEYFEFNEIPRVLHFTKKEKEHAQQELKKMGIGPEDRFICFHSRDSAYLRKIPTARSGSYQYHDHRDCDIERYVKAMEYVASKGYYAIRMGAEVEKPLPDTGNPSIIDYAINYRSDFMDVYLCANNFYFVGCSAGLMMVPTVFNVPVACANWVPYEISPFRKGDMYIPKKFMEIKTGKYISFKEIFDNGYGLWTSGLKFKEAGLEVVESTEEEILEMVKEMHGIMTGERKYSQEEKELQKKYNSLMKPHHLCYGNPAVVSACFLSNNLNLLR